MEKIRNGKTIKDVLTSIKDKYIGKVEIQSGKLDYVSEENMTEYAWAKEAFDGVAADFDKVSSSDTNSVQINNASAGKIESLRIYGNSVQQQCKNFLYTSKTTQELNGVTLTNENGVITLNGTCTTSSNFELGKLVLYPGVYTLSTNVTVVPVENSYALLQVYDSTNNQNIVVNNKDALKPTTNSISTMGTFAYRIRIEKDTVYDNFVMKPQLELGGVQTDFESHYEASPSTPIEVQSVGDLVTEGKYKDQYKIPITMSGKNLFDGTLYSLYPDFNGKIGENTQMKSIILPIKKGETLTYSNTKSTSFQRYIVTKELPVANLVILANQINSFTGNTVSITNELDKDGYLILCTYRSTVTDYSETEFFKEVQIERGKEATKYEPYTLTTTNIYLNEPLRKVGDAVDYIDFKNKKVVRNVGTMEHTTNTTATRGKNATESGVYRNYIIPSPLMKVGTNIDGLCTTLATNKKRVG